MYTIDQSATMITRTPAIAAVLALAITAGCGTSDATNEQQIRQVADRLAAGYNRHDPDTVCQTIIPSSRVQMVAAMKILDDDIASCEDAIRAVTALTDAKLEIELDDIRVAGDKATAVNVRAGKGTDPVTRFERIGGKWLVATDTLDQDDTATVTQPAAPAAAPRCTLQRYREGNCLHLDPSAG